MRLVARQPESSEHTIDKGGQLPLASTFSCSEALRGEIGVRVSESYRERINGEHVDSGREAPDSFCQVGQIRKRHLGAADIMRTGSAVLFFDV